MSFENSRQSIFRSAAAIFAALLIGTSAAEAQSLRPKELLIYYGYPSSINATYTVAGAAAELGQYDYVVLGDGLEKTTHPDHTNTVDIIAHASMVSTTVFGYIDLGATTQNLYITEVKTRVDEWQTTGADGVFFDDFGYDFQTSRARQNEAVDYAHSKNMPVVANAFVPADAFSSAVDATYNPTGTATSLGSSDFYLYESHQIIVGAFVSESTWQSKANALKSFQDALGFKILSITTNDATNAYDEDKFFYSWCSALLYGHEATGWGEYNFSASTASAPYRARPATDPGSSFTSGIVNNSPVYSRTTDLGTIEVNASTHTCTFNGQLVPVELLTFAASAAGNEVTLTWSTASEAENLGFDVYRSASANGEYAQVNEEMISGAGNSGDQHDYAWIDNNVKSGDIYYYKLADVDYQGNTEFHGPVAVTIAAPPATYRLAQNFPNPFNPSTTINFSLPEASMVTLAIFDLKGKLVKEVAGGKFASGHHSMVWDATDRAGQREASGVYVYRLQAGLFSAEKKLVLMK